MAAHGAPKHRCLDKNTSVTAFERWRLTLFYVLALLENSTNFLAPGASWQKKTKPIVLQGFTNDGESVAEALQRWRNTVERSDTLELIQGQIANFCSVVIISRSIKIYQEMSRNTAMKDSISLNDVWQAIRMYFDFRTAGGHIFDFTCIKPVIDERLDDLYQRKGIVAVVEYNMARAESSINITHHGVVPTVDEERSRTIENLIFFWWLHLVDVELPKLVKQKYELRSRALASIKAEILAAMDSLREDRHYKEGFKVDLFASMQPRRRTFKNVPSTRRHRQLVKRVGPLRSCSPPTAVFGLRSFIGTYRVLFHDIPNCESVVRSLQYATNGRESQEPVSCSDQGLKRSSQFQKALYTNKDITSPKPEDKIWFIIDGFMPHPGIGGSVYITRSGSTYLAGFSNMKTETRMLTWVPCEIKALAIASSVRDCGPYIIQPSTISRVYKLSQSSAEASILLTTFL